MEENKTVQSTDIKVAGLPEEPTISMDLNDMNSELDKMAAETPEAPVVEETVTEPVDTEPSSEDNLPVQQEEPKEPVIQKVPEKFKTPEGEMDTEKVVEATKQAEMTIQEKQDVLQKYLEKEKELGRTQNKVHQVTTQEPTQIPVPTQPQVQGKPFAEQIEEDIEKYGHGEVMARILQARNNVENSELADKINKITADIELSKSRTQLEGLSKKDTWVLTPEGFDTLSKIKADNPWIDSAPNPWDIAHKLHLAQKAQMSNSQVTTPTPTAETVKAPPTPVNAANQTNTNEFSHIDTSNMSDSELNLKLSKLTPKQEDRFWAKQGIPKEFRK